MNKTNKKQGIISISGKDYKVNFSIGYFNEYFAEATGIDLIKQGSINILFEVDKNAILRTAGFVYAGRKAQCSFEKKPFDLSFDDAKYIVYCLDENDLAILMKECYALYFDKSSVEEYDKWIQKLLKESEKKLHAQAGIKDKKK